MRAPGRIAPQTTSAGRSSTSADPDDPGAHAAEHVPGRQVGGDRVADRARVAAQLRARKHHHQVGGPAERVGDGPGRLGRRRGGVVADDQMGRDDRGGQRRSVRPGSGSRMRVCLQREAGRDQDGPWPGCKHARVVELVRRCIAGIPASRRICTSRSASGS